MANEFKRAFDYVRADDNLKSSTMQFLRSEMQRRRKAPAFYRAKRPLTALACTLLIIISVIPYRIYITPNAFVDVDVNPSIELVLNRFNRVINAYAYNSDDLFLLENISITHKKYDEALNIVISQMDEYGYIGDDSLISVTLQTDDVNKEDELLSGIRANLTKYETTDIFTVSCDTRSTAHQVNLSPAKYIAIQELIEVDPTATIDICRTHSIKEIKQLTVEHSLHHDGDINAASEPFINVDDNLVTSDQSSNIDDDETVSAPDNYHKGRGHHGHGYNQH